MRHKWFVLIATIRIGGSLRLAFIHDFSKFRPSEWFPYANTFYKKDGSNQYNETPEFNKAWLFHQHRNPHHWQHWILKMDRGDTTRIQIPTKYIYEMVADWMGAGRAITGKWDIKEWYERNKNNIDINQNTRNIVENIIKET